MDNEILIYAIVVLTIGSFALTLFRYIEERKNRKKIASLTAELKERNIVMTNSISLDTHYSIVKQKEEDARKDSLERSRSIIKGQVSENMVLLLREGLDYFGESVLSDFSFLGKPIDFIEFKGSSSSNIEEIVFVEIKTGNSRLTKAEQQIKAAIEAGKVSWKEVRLK